MNKNALRTNAKKARKKTKTIIIVNRIKTTLVSAMLAVAPATFAQTSGETVGTLDLNLAKAIEIALAENPTIKVADKEIELKKVADKEAWQNLLPTLSGSLALQHNIQVAEIKAKMPGSTEPAKFKMGMDGTTTASGGLTLNLPLYAPAVYQNMKLTKEDIQLAQEKARGSRLDLVNQVKKAYYAALLAKDSYDVIQRSYKVADENNEIVSSKYAVGKVSEYDKLSAEVQLRSMNSALVSAESGMNLALLQLKVLMGVTENVSVNIMDDLRNYQNSLTVEDSSVTMELDNNTGLRQLDMNEALLQRTRKLLKTNFIPTIGLQLSYQYQSMSNDNWNVFKYEYSPSSTLNLAVSIPIFTASNWTKLKSNKIQLSQLQDTRENTVRQLRMAVESYRRNMQSSIAQVESNRTAVEQATKAVAISSKRYEIGGGTILELNQTETMLTQAELTFNQSLYDYLTNKADLDYTLGRE